MAPRPVSRLARVGLWIAAAGVVTAFAPWYVAAQVRPALPDKMKLDYLSSGSRAWWEGPQDSGGEPGNSPVKLGTNVDANNPSKDLAAGQAETAIALAGSRVMAAWNDATGFLVAPSTERRASLTGVGYSSNAGKNFKDLIGLPNDNPNQQWFGDPTVVAVDGGNAFIVGSLYLPSSFADCSMGPVEFNLAVSVAKVSPTNQVTFGNPVVVVHGGDLCLSPAPDDLASFDKEFLSYDSVSRTLVMSYIRFSFFTPGLGQVEIARAHVPANPSTLNESDFEPPIVVWPEEIGILNQGPYVALAPGGDAYVTWERNWNSNLFNGLPRVYIHAARVRAGDTSPSAGGPSAPRVVTRGQVNSDGQGGVKSLDAVSIAGYSRGIGNDFPRVAYDAVHDLAIFVWNDASLHPLGDVFMRAIGRTLPAHPTRLITKLNDDDSFALHFLPAVSTRSDGSMATSWYDRRLAGPTSTRTDYWGEIRSTPGTPGRDFRITTGDTDWSGTSSLISPNFGDYTDNASDGTTTVFTWSDGRIGVPQPFVDSR